MSEVPKRPEPRPMRPDPFVYSDPFWGDTPTWLAVMITIGFALAVVFVGLLVGMSIA